MAIMNGGHLVESMNKKDAEIAEYKIMMSGHKLRETQQDTEIAALKQRIKELEMYREATINMESAREKRIKELEHDLDTIQVKDSELFQRLELQGRIKELEALNAKYKSALTTIMQINDPDETDTGRIAREALKED